MWYVLATSIAMPCQFKKMTKIIFLTLLKASIHTISMISSLDLLSCYIFVCVGSLGIFSQFFTHN